VGDKIALYMHKILDKTMDLYTIQHYLKTLTSLGPENTKMLEVTEQIPAFRQKYLSK